MSEKSTITGRAVVDCTIDQFEEEILAILGLDETCVKVLVDPRETSLQNDTYSLWRAKASARCGYASAFRPMASPRYRNLCFAGVCSDGRNYCTLDDRWDVVALFLGLEAAHDARPIGAGFPTDGALETKKVLPRFQKKEGRPMWCIVRILYASMMARYIRWYHTRKRTTEEEEDGDLY